MSADLAAFLQTARTEVARYGDDDDVFVRELVQNARDANARSIAFTRIEQGEHEIVCVDDDGSGMSREIIGNVLLRLFSSQKAGSQTAAGCFGVGFWSVLRFADVDVVVETHDGLKPCQLRIDLVGSQLHEEPSRRTTRGTRIVLRRRRRPEAFALRAAILRHACHVTGNDGPPPRLELAGELLNRPLEQGFDDVNGASPVLASRSIEGDGFRGVVGLCAQPHIELLHHGLRVVEASSLLALVPSKKRGEPRGLGLSARIDVDALTVLVDRKTVVEDDRLRAIVDACDAAARRLEREALDSGAPLRLIDAMVTTATRVLTSTALRLVVLGVMTMVLGAALGFATLWVVRPDLRSRIPIPFRVPRVMTTTPMARALDGAALRFDAPRIDVRGADPGGWDVDVYGVGTAQLRLFTLSMPEEARGLVARPQRPHAFEPYPAGRMIAARLAFRTDTAGLVILPSSSSLTPVRVIIGGVGHPVGFADDDGNPIFFVPKPGVLTVELAKGADRPTRPREQIASSTSPELQSLVDATGGLRGEARIDALVGLVQRSIAYSADSTSAGLFDADRRPFVERALGLGRGDCDVINTVLVRALLAAGFDARLAVGLVVVDDVVADDLHAWAEVRAHKGAPWTTVDASPPDARPRPGPASAVDPRTNKPGVPAAATTTTPTTTTPFFVPRSALRVAMVISVLLFVMVGMLLVRHRRQAQRRPRVDLLPLFLAGLSSGAAERLGLKRRPFVPTLDGALLSLDDAAALFGKARLARGSVVPAWLHRSVAVLDDDDPCVTALRPFLPPAIKVSELSFVDDPRLAGLQELIDRRFAGVHLCTASAVPAAGGVDVVTELHVRTTAGATHLVMVPRGLLDRLSPAELVDAILAGASCLRGLR
ncbi:MAG: ATP-binding protein [Deltaproteobacteria bacterium]|nr:ATP-binding protein [Deltaproteobacteria bacterium]